MFQIGSSVQSDPGQLSFRTEVIGVDLQGPRPNAASRREISLVDIGNDMAAC